MIELNKGNTSEKIVVTLSEKSKLNTPYFLFVFKSVPTETEVSFVAGADLSPYPERYNEFEVNTQELFSEAAAGEYHYTAYEQVSEDNLDIANTFGIVEVGKMKLRDSEEFQYEQYNESTTFKSYNG